jgi:hypothetical protein
MINRLVGEEGDRSGAIPADTLVLSCSLTAVAQY